MDYEVMNELIRSISADLEGSIQDIEWEKNAEV